MSEKFNLDVCFLSIFFPNDNETYRNKSKKMRPQNITVIQHSLIDGLTAFLEEKPWIINTPLLSTFPNGYDDPIVRRSPLVRKYRGVNHGFLNFSPCYSTSLFFGARKHIKKWARNGSGKPKVVIAYSLTSYTLQAMKYIKKLDNQIKTCIIVPDLPQYTYEQTNSPIRKLRNYMGKTKAINAIERKADYVDGWLYFSEKMKEKIPGNTRYMVFEGVYTDVPLVRKHEKPEKAEPKVVLYAGGLNLQYGVGLLLNAFSQLKGKAWKLMIAGTGPMEMDVLDACKYDDRIEYLGVVPHEELVKLEQSVDVLVNPRIDSGIFTRYSFPSKNMEYLSMGVPMVGYKLAGIPDIYDDFINYFSQGTPESLAQTISYVCGASAEEAKERAEKAREYVKGNKNKNTWGRKILSFISDL